MNKYFLLAALFFGSCAGNSSTSKTIGSIERIDPSLDSLIDKNAAVEIVADGFKWSEGPAWIEDQQALIFSDIPNNKVFKWSEAKGLQPWLTPSGYTGSKQRGGESGSNGLIITPQQKLVLCQHGNRQIAMMDAPLNDPKPIFISLAHTYKGKQLNSPNDIVYRSNGDYFFTDPPYGLEKNMDDPAKELSFQGVYKISAAGQIRLLLDTISRPNGIAFLPGEKELVIANSDPEKPAWYLFEVGNNDTLISKGMLYNAIAESKKEKGMPDGMKIDRDGNIFATGPGGVWIFGKDHKIIGKIKIPQPCSNIAFADNEKTIFITANMFVLRLKMRR